MRWRPSNLWSPAAISTVVMIPFVVLEIADTAPGGSSIETWFLLAVMWLILFVFVLVLRTVVRDFTYIGCVTAHPIRVSIRVAILVALGAGFALLAIDRITP